jgi:hypothetical protein
LVFSVDSVSDLCSCSCWLGRALLASMVGASAICLGWV